MKKYYLFLLLVLFCSQAGKSQFIEDALRFSSNNGFISARTAGLNIAYYGVSDDMSALLFNPAGLSLIGKAELGLGLGFSRNNSKTNYIGNTNEFSSNDAFITNFGVVAPFVTKHGNAAVGIAYFQENNFKDNYEYQAINTKSTMIDYYSKYGTRKIENNYTYHLWLANENLFTPLKDSLEQYAFIQENGGLHNVTGGAAFDLTKEVSVGFSISGKWGIYKYNRDYREYDIFNKYNYFDSAGYTNLDFKQFNLSQNLIQKIAGITGAIGIQAKIEEFFRFGVSIKFPTYYEIDEKFNVLATAEFDNGWKPNPYDPDEFENSYKVTTPFVYSAGLSLHTSGLTFMAGVEYSDVTQLEFSDAPKEVLDLNKQIVRELVGQVNWGVGVEYDIPLTPFIVRGSFASKTSPYSTDVAGASKSFLSLGGGIYLAPNVRLDAVFQWTSLSQLRTNYGNAETGELFKLTNNPLNLGLSITYRY